MRLITCPSPIFLSFFVSLFFVARAWNDCLWTTGVRKESSDVSDRLVHWLGIAETIVHLSFGESGGYLPPLRWITRNRICATTDGEERLETTWPSKVFNASFYRGEEVCHINHLPAEGIVIMTQSRWWESHFRILWDAIVCLEYMSKIIINSFTQKLVGLIY